MEKSGFFVQMPSALDDNPTMNKYLMSLMVLLSVLVFTVLASAFPVSTPHPVVSTPHFTATPHVSSVPHVSSTPHVSGGGGSHTVIVPHIMPAIARHRTNCDGGMECQETASGEGESMGVGGWVLLGLLVLVFFGAIFVYERALR